MSTDATRATWKLPKSSISAIQKLILLALADRSGENAECWPSLKRMIEDTNLDRKTLIDNRQILISKGLIQYTGEFMGKQKQIPIMRLTYVNKENSPENVKTGQTFTGAKNGTGEVFTSTENGTGTSTENGTGNQYRKRDTESKRIEPKIESLRECGETPSHPQKKVDLSFMLDNNPHYIPEQMIHDWLLTKKTVTKTLWTRTNNELTKCIFYGVTAIEVFEEMVAGSWKTLNHKWYEERHSKKKQGKGLSIYDVMRA